MSTQPLISVVVPTFNRAAMLPAALDSVWAQEYRPIELVVVDDGSDDNTAEVVAGWQRQHASNEFRVAYRHQAHAGAAAARNTGLRAASGALLHFLDSDCSLAADFFVRLVRALAGHPAASFAYGVTDFVRPDGTLAERVGRAPATNRWDDAVSTNMTCIAPLFRRQALDGAEWNEALVCLEDWAFKAGVILRHGSGVFVPAAVATARLHGGDRISKHGTAGFLRGQQEAVQFVSSLLPATAEPDFAKGVLGAKLLSVARGYLRLGMFPEARDAIRAAAACGGARRARVRLANAFAALFGIRALAWVLTVVERV